jgi:N-methylhydantoinase A
VSPTGPVAGVDTGGTFTDAVSGGGAIAKVLSTPADPSQAVAAALGELDRAGSGPGAGAAGIGGGTAVTTEASRLSVLAHGTTIATNALLERKGAVTALLTNEGFADVIEIARQDRPSLYDQWVDRPVPLVARDLRLEIGGRLGPTGEELAPISLDEMPDLPAEVEAVAVCLLHADLEDAHESAVVEHLTATRPGLVVSRSSAVAPEFREYERTVTTVVNAYLGPPCRLYLERMDSMAQTVYVMSSAGGLVSLREAVERPASLLVSGPAAGVAAGASAALAAGFSDVVTFDMGGTSTDVCLVRGGGPEPAVERRIAGLPIRLPSLDVHTIGAGGGSIAEIDPGGALAVGPRSAGARPGPACYGLGGTAPTVTDADLVAGRIPSGATLPGIGPLNVEAARHALDAAGVSAEGVIAVVNESMAQAIRAVTIERGVDPRSLALVAFGGAGPLHACDLAEALDMRAVVVPARAGVLSAVGLLSSRPQVDLVRSWPRRQWTAEEMDGAMADLGSEVREELLARSRSGAPSALGQDAASGRGDASGHRPAVRVETALDCRYAGQSHELRVERPADFHAEHRRRNGFSRPGAPVEVVAIRARASTEPLVAVEELPGTSTRTPAVGPVSLLEPDCSVWLPRGWRAELGGAGSWVLTR